MDLEGLKEKIKEDKEGKFAAFCALLKEYNKKFNLTSVIDDEGIFFRHLLDSVAAVEYFEDNAAVCEVGSGGGFPSVPLKILREDLKFTLIESTAKKCGYLNKVKIELGFKDFEILNIRAEDGGKRNDLREKFDVCCARAVAPLNTLSEYCLPFVRVGGKFIAYKGDCDTEISEAKRAIEVLGGRIKEILRYEVENCGKRTLIIVEKIKNTPQKYPRGLGKERKSPIV